MKKLLLLLAILVIGCAENNPVDDGTGDLQYQCVGTRHYGSGFYNKCTGETGTNGWWGICNGKTSKKGTLCKETSDHLKQGC
jgi:hypothetical protein